MERCCTRYTQLKVNSEKIDIKEVKVSTYIVPTDGPESDGTIEWNSTTLVLVVIKAGEKSGTGYSYADISSAYSIERNLKKIIIGKNALNIPCVLKSMTESVRNNGNYGIIAMAISATAGYQVIILKGQSAVVVLYMIRHVKPGQKNAIRNPACLA